MATNGCYIKYIKGDKFEIKVAEKDKRKLKKPVSSYGVFSEKVKIPNKIKYSIYIVK